MNGKISYFKQKGDPYIFATSLGLIASLGMVAFIVLVILFKGLGFFWPHPLTQVQLQDGTRYLGERWAEDTNFVQDESGREIRIDQLQFKIGNRDLYGRDFVWVKSNEIQQLKNPPFATSFERWEYGNFYGFIREVHAGARTIVSDEETLFQRARQLHAQAKNLKQEIEDTEKELHEISEPLSVLEREISLLEISEHARTPQGQQQLQKLRDEAQQLQEEIADRYGAVEARLAELYHQNQEMYLTVETGDGQQKQLLLSSIVRFYQPNRMSLLQKTGHYAAKLGEFLAANPRESNTEGGVFPAIFGTVMMVLLMSIAVVPFGVLAAIYLNEYARQGPVIRLIRLSVNNLAGVPSIVFGVFGLGFFIYMMGTSIDQLFFSSKLPEPTFGTGGILWASLTLALLTLPVVVVATEEGLLAVPRANKEGALALGATKWQMIRRIALPNALPGIFTGLILAVSRGAGEVAPLMITGVVKLAPSLPIDGSFPFLHLDRKFMHLGFHIYDVGFQSPNVEAAKPMVYMTALLLILIVVVLNLLTIYLRNRLRKKYKSAAF